MVRKKQDPPFCIQIELTEGCNLYCDFCGLQGIRKEKEKNFKFLSIKNAERIASSIKNAKWNSRIEFAMHGEPTMNPDFINVVSIFRKTLPSNQLMMTSNGGGLLKVEKIKNLFEAGLNILAIDEYEYVLIGAKIRSALNNIESGWESYEYPENKIASPHRRWPKNTKALIFVKDISSAKEGVHATINNHCGSGAPTNDKGAGKRCAKPFRELSIRWNGEVAICCNDWRGVYKCGNVVKEDIKDIWNNEAFNLARKFLYRGMREFTPCKGCDALSYRVGLLPDKLGKVSLPKPTSKDRNRLSAFNAGKSLTVAIKRPWEK